MADRTGDAAALARPLAARVRILVRGAVQGVGFRPFIYRLAHELGLTGWVNNSPLGVTIEAEGPPKTLEQFLLRIQSDRPPLASIHGLEQSHLDAAGFTDFTIRPSEDAGAKTALIVPDIATCADCLREVMDPADRRYLYPFTNCTNCGPRFSIIERLPYDRPHTSMRRFTMCERCAAEYEDPGDRRFHAQPNACPECGPTLSLWDAAGAPMAERHEALLAAAKTLADGGVLAIKGLGGFHLMVDARSEDAVRRLRARKHREAKPLALMVPSLAAVEVHCDVSPLEARLLASPEAPIVLLRRRKQAPAGAGAVGTAAGSAAGSATGAATAGTIAPSVAPSTPYLGVLLPYTPMHHLLMRQLGFPVVATSGNVSEEPIVTDERLAVDRLRGIADRFLVHDRPIVRHVDDSIARVVMGRELVLRRARGYAPLPIKLRRPCSPVLAVGAHLKNTVALAHGTDVFVSQHIGDLSSEPSLAAFRSVVGTLPALYEVHPTRVACDLHPDYTSTRFARDLHLPVHAVQHHHAHIVACMAENEIEGPVLGVAWDGAGHGTDGTLWGGEFLVATDTVFTRVGSFRGFCLPGGFKAIREPRRSALGLLHEILGASLFDTEGLAPLEEFKPSERLVLRGMLERRVNAPRTSSVGRLFDAVASIARLAQVSRFEGQAAMELEFALDGFVTDERYPTTIQEPDGAAGHAVVDWEPLIRALLGDVAASVVPGLLAARFHNGLAETIVCMARRVGLPRVVLSGGCFQNGYLLERTVTRLASEGFRPCWHQRVPTNDGGISLGQAVAGAYSLSDAASGMRSAPEGSGGSDEP